MESLGCRPGLQLLLIARPWYWAQGCVESVLPASERQALVYCRVSPVERVGGQGACRVLAQLGESVRRCAFVTTYRVGFRPSSLKFRISVLLNEDLLNGVGLEDATLLGKGESPNIKSTLMAAKREIDVREREANAQRVEKTEMVERLEQEMNWYLEAKRQLRKKASKRTPAIQ